MVLNLFCGKAGINIFKNFQHDVGKNHRIKKRGWIRRPLPGSEAVNQGKSTEVSLVKLRESLELYVGDNQSPKIDCSQD